MTLDESVATWQSSGLYEDQRHAALTVACRRVTYITVEADCSNIHIRWGPQRMVIV